MFESIKISGKFNFFEYRTLSEYWKFENILSLLSITCNVFFNFSDSLT